MATTLIQCGSSQVPHYCAGERPGNLLPEDQIRYIIRLGTWNVRTMNQGKLDIVKAKMDRTGLDLLRISELKWTQSGHFQSNEHWVYYSGNDNQRRNGVAFILNQRLANTVLKYNTVSDRVISIRLQGAPIHVTVIQVYSPTTDAKEEDVELFYEQVQEEIDRTQNQDLLIIMGDFNAKVGHGKQGTVVGKFGLSKRNEAGERLIDFCTKNQLSIMNTFFQHHKRRLYTWTSPNGAYKNQIDYICVRQRWRSSIITVKTQPGADCGTDHELLTSKIRVKLHKR
ncbi:craniofacial development protein 2-like, partial [Trichomycterus rosablanca]|uniref:craniofacial development protein 2-like n=1 Tax=Trichomycterus rosablanca TaxID=2290929 RepID=UPI002F3502AC